MTTHFDLPVDLPDDATPDERAAIQVMVRTSRVWAAGNPTRRALSLRGIMRNVAIHAGFYFDERSDPLQPRFLRQDRVTP